jgi:uncharacterized membrane protein YcaP (DUF421 family)
MEIIQMLFGEGKELNTLQMGCRAFVMFFITLVLIRIAGMRSFGKKSSFDNIIVIMLGAVLSRAIAGASPFVPTVVAGLVLALIHKLIANVTAKNKMLGRLIKGEKTLLFKEGQFNTKNLNKCDLSREDIMEELRMKLNQNTLDNLDEIFMETSGKLSLVKKRDLS